MIQIIFIFAFLGFLSLAQAQHEGHGDYSEPMPGKPMIHSHFCADDQTLDLGSGMCVELFKNSKGGISFVTHGNLFLVANKMGSDRGYERLSAPNMLMFDARVNKVNSRHTWGVNLMLTFEKWTFPQEGYPELFQIGEHDRFGSPYIDAQHPHSSPLMGLTFSDTIRANDESLDHLKFFFAPRGQTTEGPLAFMHRNTGMLNPDAPLGHHIGQDVGHIASTVIGAMAQTGRTTIEISGFNGTEPEPDVVETRLGDINSGAVRLGYQFAPRTRALASFAYVEEPEHDGPAHHFLHRYSASLYNEWSLPQEWTFYNTLIYGRVDHMDEVTQLHSFGEEFLFNRHPMNFWGRLEYLQRTAGQLDVASADPEKAEWLTALTLGYTHDLAMIAHVNLQAGFSATQYLIPSDWESAYGSNPWAAKVFLQLSGMSHK